VVPAISRHAASSRSLRSRRAIDVNIAIMRAFVRLRQMLLSHEELFMKLYDRLPKELLFIRELILSSLWRSPEHWGLAPE